jgi:hypothetical protein
VTIRNVDRNTTTSAVSDDNGAYTALFLVPGTCEVQVGLQGFKSWRRAGLVLQVNDRLRIDAALEVGGLEETTTVLASAPVVRTDSSEVGTVIEETAIKELPLNGRNFATLVYLVPGITPGQANENLSGASTFNPRGASNFNALGHQANSNGWLVDGIDNNEFTFNTVIVSPSVEQVREFKVLSGVFSAEFGRGAGVVSVSTKSGTNQLRGTAFEFLRNDAFDARNFFVRKTPQADGSLLKTRCRRSIAISSAARSAARWSFPASTTGTIARSSSRIIPASANGAALRPSTPCQAPRRATATSATIAIATAI